MTENATIYSCRLEFPNELVLRWLIEQDVRLSVDQDGGLARIIWPDGLKVRITAMAPEGLAEHLMGFEGYVRAQGGDEALAIRVLGTQTVLGFVIKPGFDEEGRVIELVGALTRLQHGVLFLDGGVYDHQFRELLTADPAEQRPSAQRVARRALLLIAGAVRGLIEEDAGTADEAEAEALRRRLLEWVEGEPELAGELEAAESLLLQLPIGEAEPQQVIDAVWGAEAAQVLLWALRARPLPGHDQQEHPFELAREFDVPAAHLPSLLASPKLRSPRKLWWMEKRLLAIHWRLVEARLGAGRVDFRRFSENSFAGPVDLEGIPLVHGDLALGDGALASAEPAEIARVGSIARERHRAINWLVGVNPIYSQVVTPT